MVDWRIATLLTIMSCIAGCTCNDKLTKQTYEVTILPEAAGATRLLSSPNGRHMVAELGGEWRYYAPSSGEIPPVLKLMRLPDGEVHSTVNGWALGAPDDDGDLLYLEEVGEEYRYQLRSTKRPGQSLALTPPDGYWLPRATLRSLGGPAVVVLWRPRRQPDNTRSHRIREDLWIAVIDPATLAVRNAKILPITPIVLGKRFDEGIAINPAGSYIYLVDRPAYDGPAEWTIIALDLSDLHELWRTEIPGRSVSGGGESNRRKIKLVPDGLGRRLAVFYGRRTYDAINTEVIHILDASTGATIAEHDRIQLGLPGSGLYYGAPVPNNGRVALLHRHRYRPGITESSEEYLDGVWLLDLNGPTIEGSYQVTRDRLGDDFERMRAFQSHAMAVSPSGRAFLAPLSFYWVNTWLKGDWPQSDGQMGADSPEVRGLVVHPDWHRPKRPRVEARQAHIRQMRSVKPLERGRADSQTVIDRE